MPLVTSLNRWMCSITGPPDTPYEGGKFYLLFDYPDNVSCQSAKLISNILDDHVIFFQFPGLMSFTDEHYFSITDVRFPFSTR